MRKRAGERGRSKVEPSSRTSSEKVVLVWCCELKFSIQTRKQEGSPQKVLTIISYLAKEVSPFLDDLCTAGLDDFHYVPQGALGDAGVVVAQIALASFGDPNFRGVSVGRTLAHVDVDRFQGGAFIGPEEHPVGADLKDLRHGRSPPPGRIAKSGGRWTRSLPDSG